MALFKKRKDVRELRLPELPSVAFPELPREDNDMSMPSFPQLKPVQRMPVLPQFSQMQPLPQLPSMMNREETPLLRPMTMEISEEKNVRMGKGPVFVRLEKFKDALATFELVKKKLHESSSVLERIKETRAKEEEELTAWTNELNAIKERISQIDRKIFSSVD